jgi:hypothetical protein
MNTMSKKNVVAKLEALPDELETIKKEYQERIAAAKAKAEQAVQDRADRLAAIAVKVGPDVLKLSDEVIAGALIKLKEDAMKGASSIKDLEDRGATFLGGRRGGNTGTDKPKQPKQRKSNVVDGTGPAEEIPPAAEITHATGTDAPSAPSGKSSNPF